MTAEQEAAAGEASALKTNPFLTAALASLRTEATEALAQVEPTNADVIREHQATVRCIDTLMARIEQAVMAGTPRRTTGVA